MNILPERAKEMLHQTLVSYETNPLAAPTDPYNAYWYRVGLLRAAVLMERGTGITPETEAMIQSLAYRYADFPDDEEQHG